MIFHPSLCRALGYPPGTEFLSCRAAARRVGLHISTVYRAVHEGRLRVVRVAGTRLWVPEPEVLALVKVTNRTQRGQAVG